MIWGRRRAVVESCRARAGKAYLSRISNWYSNKTQNSWVCSAACKSGCEHNPGAVKFPMAWTLSGPFPALKTAYFYLMCSMSKVEGLTVVVKQWWTLESTETVLLVANCSNEDNQALSLLNDTIRSFDTLTEDTLCVLRGMESKRSFWTLILLPWVGWSHWRQDCKKWKAKGAFL